MKNELESHIPAIFLQNGMALTSSDLIRATHEQLEKIAERLGQKGTECFVDRLDTSGIGGTYEVSVYLRFPNSLNFQIAVRQNQVIYVNDLGHI